MFFPSTKKRVVLKPTLKQPQPPNMVAYNVELGGGAVALVANTSSAAHRNFPTVLYGMIRCAEVAVVKNARRNQPANVFSSLQIFAEQCWSEIFVFVTQGASSFSDQFYSL